MADWQPIQYLKYRNERTQPTVDLVNRIDIRNIKRIIDIGCGPGNSTAILKSRWSEADVYGVDNSSNMIEKAKSENPDIGWLMMDALNDLSSLGKFDIVFSNAALQWMPGHEKLIPKLFNMLQDNGVLAVQVPCVKDLPVYSEIQRIIKLPKWRDFFKAPPVYPKHFTFNHYYDIICNLTDSIEIWQTDYIHIMSSHADILEWYKGSGLRPFLDMLPDTAMKEAFCGDYLDGISKAYPTEIDGRILLPFTRIFFMVNK